MRVKLFLLLIFFAVEGFARVEYALKNRFISCTQCHVNPAGGGIRNLSGKLYGSGNFKPGVFSKNSFFQADVRQAAQMTQTETRSRRGFLVMTTNLAVHIPIIESKDEPLSYSFVAANGFGLLESGLRESYLFIRSNSENPAFEGLLIGRVTPLFGLPTEEHRTYTRLQTRSSLAKRDIESGLQFSSSGSYFHYDIQLTSGDKDGGATSATNESPWGATLNLRLLPWHGPIMLGASTSRHRLQAIDKELKATSVWLGWSLDRILPISFFAEIVRAKSWNNPTANPQISNFIPSSDSAYQNAVSDSESEGVLFLANYEASRSWSLMAKAEQFIPDIDYKSDSFIRYGVGGKWQFNSNMNLQVRHENSYSTRPGYTQAGIVTATEKFNYALLHIWL